MTSIDHLIHNIGQSTKILVLVGSGISVNAGIPDFRSKDLGIYRRYDFDVEDALHIESFKDDPTALYTLVCELALDVEGSVRHFSPTATHKFLKQLHNSGKLLRVYSQNIDGLDCEPVGLRRNREVIQCHGDMRRIVCASCGHDQKIRLEEWLKDVRGFIRSPRQFTGGLRCSSARCDGLTKPDLVLFGESLPASFFRNIQRDTQVCDLVLVLGSSMSVFPFAAIPAMLHSDSVPRFVVCKNYPGSTSAILIDEDCDEVVKRIADVLNFSSID